LFALRLAANVAHTTDVDGMLESMTPQQLAEWRAYDQIEPISDAGTHDVLAMIGGLIAAYLGAKDVEGVELGPWHFTHWREKPKPTQDNSRALSALLLSMGAKRG
jgi:hypothetical protein